MQAHSFSCSVRLSVTICSASQRVYFCVVKSVIVAGVTALIATTAAFADPPVKGSPERKEQVVEQTVFVTGSLIPQRIKVHRVGTKTVSPIPQSALGGGHLIPILALPFVTLSDFPLTQRFGLVVLAGCIIDILANLFVLPLLGGARLKKRAFEHSAMMHNLRSMQAAFYQSESDQPHPGRARAIIKAHPEVRQLMVRNPWTALIALSVVVLQTSLAFWFGKLGFGYCWLSLVIAYCVGAFANHANYVIIHDATHNLIFRNKSWNKLVGILADLPNLNPGAMGFRVYHLRHHSHQGDYEHDADLANHL